MMAGVMKTVFSTTRIQTELAATIELLDVCIFISISHFSILSNVHILSSLVKICYPPTKAFQPNIS